MVLSDSSFQEHQRPKMHLQKLLAIKLGNMPSNTFAPDWCNAGNLGALRPPHVLPSCHQQAQSS